MRVPDFLARPKLLISAMVAFWLTGLAHGETAGRVNFVTGEAVAVKPDNTRRILTRGDLVNSGERLETGDKARIQIRFTDGSFIALQPNTTFSLDTYTYQKDKPEQSSLVFNFLRGSMRTISGAIGKVNRASYQIKTPTATIGIRGTDYAGIVSNDQLLLNVLGGIVNLSNSLGNADVKTGQTFVVKLGTAPALFNGPFPGTLDAIEPDVTGAATTAAGGAVTAAAAVTELPERPRLENYENYNQFLQAMYAFKKAEAARNQALQPAPSTAPTLDLEKLKEMGPVEADLETETIESTATPSLVTEGPETIEAAVAKAQQLHLPHYSPGENYHRSTFRSFPLQPVEQPTLETASIDGSFRLGVTSTQLVLGQMGHTEDQGNTSSMQLQARPDLANKQMTLLIERGDHVLTWFGNVVQIHGLDDLEITWIIRK